jgi:hypothetical protein
MYYTLSTKCLIASIWVTVSPSNRAKYTSKSDMQLVDAQNA